MSIQSSPRSPTDDHLICDKYMLDDDGDADNDHHRYLIIMGILNICYTNYFDCGPTKGRAVCLQTKQRNGHGRKIHLRAPRGEPGWVPGLAGAHCTGKKGLQINDCDHSL